MKENPKTFKNDEGDWTPLGFFAFFWSVKSVKKKVPSKPGQAWPKIGHFQEKSHFQISQKKLLVTDQKTYFSVFKASSPKITFFTFLQICKKHTFGIWEK